MKYLHGKTWAMHILISRFFGHKHEKRKTQVMEFSNFSTFVTLILSQGVVTPIRTVVTAKIRVKKWSTGQGVFLPLIKGSRTICLT